MQYSMMKMRLVFFVSCLHYSLSIVSLIRYFELTRHQHKSISRKYPIKCISLLVSCQH